MHILNDFKTSVRKAFDEIDLHWESYDGLVVAGTHSPHNTDEIIMQIRKARENNVPFLGICMGFQLMAIEWVRSMGGLEQANSTEIDRQTPNPVVVKMLERHTGIRPVTWFDNTVSYESHWHSYAMNPYYLRYFPQELWDVSFGEHAIEMLRARFHPFFWGTQFHAEYQSSKDKPHKLLVEFINVCKQV